MANISPKQISMREQKPEERIKNFDEVPYGYSQEVEEIINTKKFVLEANKITDDEGKAYPGLRRQCFIMIDSTNIIIQWISEFDNNGLGGITIGGVIKSSEHIINSDDKETQHILNLTCETDQGRVKNEIKMEIYSKSHAEAIVKNSSSSISLSAIDSSLIFEIEPD